MAFVLFLPMLASQLLFGTLSCFVSLLLVHRNLTGAQPLPSEAAAMATDKVGK